MGLGHFGGNASTITRNMLRETLLLDPGWKFHLGGIDSPIPNTHIGAYMANKAGYARGAARGNFDDSDWREVDLPHDWSIEGKYDPTHHVDAGYLPRGVGWYRRYFQLDESDRNKRLSIRFDGIATHCTVWVNGHLLTRNFCGYTPFTLDITDIANFGDALNCIAVRIDATYVEGWWYEGAGIYRHVWLIKTHPVHIAPLGTFLTTKQNGSHVDVTISTTIVNKSEEPVDVGLVFLIRGVGASPTILFASLIRPPPLDRERLGEAPSPLYRRARIEPWKQLEVSQVIPLEHPLLWSCDEPNLYAIETTLECGDTIVDDEIKTFGIRTIRFGPKDGFFLNEKPLKLLGVCNHQDHAGVGVALPDSIHEFRIRRLKEMGCNAIRCAHNPPAPELLDACDRLGMLVIDENRNFGSAPEHLEQLRAMVLRDRNHPSVILWSICNEEAIQGEPTGARIARTMMHEIRKLDPTRPITAAVSGGILNDDCIASEIDVMGINYQLQTYDPYHAKHPGKPIIASETHCALSTRGEYATDPARFVFGSYDTEKAFWGNTARETWRAVSSRPFVAGMFAWTGFDYRGEPSPHEWPCVSSHWGILDTCGFEKDAFYLHKAWFTREPFVHLLPHWNWRDGEPIKVAAYTNADEVELFMNGDSIGRKPVHAIDMVEWTIPFGRGTLKALAFRQGQLIAQTQVETTTDPLALGLEIHRSFDATTIPADGDFAIPITVFAKDAQGRRVPTAQNFVTFSLEGPARILGVGNGNPTCHEPDRASSRSLFNGRAQLVIQTLRTPGEIIIRASSEGLTAATLLLRSTPASVRPFVAPVAPKHLISDWRMSPVSVDRPDPNQQIASSDMNTWQRIDPARGPQNAWLSKSGYAIYRATFTPPKIFQPAGGRIIFHEVTGVAEIFVGSVRVYQKHTLQPDSITIPFAPASGKLTLSVLILGASSTAGITRSVELLPPT